jgi:hypothetical protein
MKECRKCEYYYKRMEKVDTGITIPVGTCVREIKTPDDDDDVCMEFTEKWKPSDRFESDLGEEKWNEGNDNGFQDSLEEQSDMDDGFMKEYLTINEYKDWVETKDKLRLAVLKQQLKIEQDKDDLMKEKF